MFLDKLMRREDLVYEECRLAAQEMLSGKVPYQVAAFLALLHAKGETAEELFSFIQAMQAVMLPFPYEKGALDIVGTGGDGANTVNISTAAALLAAQLGIRVMKHGNRAASSKCGSADLLEYLGYDFNCPTRGNFTFLYAPLFHPAFKALAEIRKGLGIRTLFNLIGPLLNPAKPDHIMLGVAQHRLLPLMADVLCKMGIKHALVFHGEGTDEITTLGPSAVIEVQGKTQIAWTLYPEEYGLKRASLKDLQGGEAKLNAERLQKAMTTGEGALAETLALNGALALYLTKQVPLKEGIQRALETLKEGSAWIF